MVPSSSSLSPSSLSSSLSPSLSLSVQKQRVALLRTQWLVCPPREESRRTRGPPRSAPRDRRRRIRAASQPQPTAAPQLAQGGCRGRRRVRPPTNPAAQTQHGDETGGGGGWRLAPGSPAGPSEGPDPADPDDAATDPPRRGNTSLPPPTTEEDRTVGRTAGVRGQPSHPHRRRHRYLPRLPPSLDPLHHPCLPLRPHRLPRLHPSPAPRRFRSSRSRTRTLVSGSSPRRAWRPGSPDAQPSERRVARRPACCSGDRGRRAPRTPRRRSEAASRGTISWTTKATAGRTTRRSSPPTVPSRARPRRAILAVPRRARPPVQRSGASESPPRSAECV